MLYRTELLQKALYAILCLFLCRSPLLAMAFVVWCIHGRVVSQAELIKSGVSWLKEVPLTLYGCVVVSNVQISNTSMILIWIFNWTLPWKEYQRISLMVSRHTLRWWLGTIRLQAITCPRVGQDLCYYIVWLSCNKLRNNWLDSIWFALSLIKWFFSVLLFPNHSFFHKIAACCG